MLHSFPRLDLPRRICRSPVMVKLAPPQDIAFHRREAISYYSSGWSAHVLFGLGVVGLLLFAFALPARATLVPPAPPLEYLNQQSATSFYHSGIVTANGVVWDKNFASFVNTGITTNYNEIAFAFMECFGGGMIDELGALNLVPASYTAASRWNEPSWSGARDPASGGKIESYYNIPFAPAAGGAAVNTMRQAATTGYNNDLVGPVKANPLREHPQYMSSGPIGDRITLDRVNPINPTKNTNYLAILFGGSQDNANNLNSLVRMYNALTARGYAANQIHVLYPSGKTPGNVVPVNADATAANLQKAWTQVANGKTSPTTQIYYWSGPAHGQLTFDWVGFLKSLGQSILKEVTYSFNLVNDFVSQLKSTYAFYLGAPQASLELPFVEVATHSPASGLTAALNGDPLALIPGSGNDLYGDGSEFDYYFALTPSDVAGLSTTDSFSLSWSGADPGFELAGLTMGDAANGPSAEVPEPSGIWLLAVGLVCLGLFRRKVGAAY